MHASQRSSWRLLSDEASDGAWNLAVDEALLESCLADPDRFPVTLRFYGWNPPALSLGRGQPAPGSHDPAFLRREGIQLVRRPTGGTAVLHEHERTYSLVAPLEQAPFVAGLRDAFRQIGLALSEAMQGLGLDARPVGRGQSPDPSEAARRHPVCFSATAGHEIAVDGRKLVGSAQLRRRGAFLQHGSIPLQIDAARLAAATGTEAPREPRFVALSGVGVDCGLEELDVMLVRAFAQSFRAELVPGCLTEAETVRAVRLRTWKYLTSAWTHDGICPELRDEPESA